MQLSNFVKSLNLTKLKNFFIYGNGIFVLSWLFIMFAQFIEQKD
jgi:hypothetical protein